MGRRMQTGLLVLAIFGAAAYGAAFSTLSAQRGAAPLTTPPAAAAPPETMPPLLFKETWKEPPAAVPTSPRRSQGTYYPASQNAVTNPNLEVKLYGADAKNLTVYLHEGRFDLWTGLVGSPVAVLLKDRRNFVDLTGLARVRAIVRTGNLHSLHPVLRLPDGSLVAGDKAINTDGQFLQVEVSFGNQRWYTIEAETLAVKAQAMKVDLARVDEVGFVDLAQAGGHGSSGWANISSIEVFAKAVAR